MTDRTRRMLATNDPALAPLLVAQDDAARRAAIDAVVESIQPLVAGLIRRFRRSESSLGPEDAEDLTSAILLRIVDRLQRAAVSEAHAIEKLEGYVATLTYNAVSDFRRRRYPERTRLKNRLRYIVTSDRRFRTWSSDEELICGLAIWSDDRTAASSISITATQEMRDQDRPAESVAAMLQAAGAPLTLSALVRSMADIWSIHDAAPDRESWLAAAPADQLTSLESKQYLGRLWSEIEALPARQRAALLLNLRDGHGGNAVTLFLLLDIAPAERIAEAVGMSVEQLAQVWEKLPLDDLSIAGMLGLTRAQIIGLRRAARARLHRRTVKQK